jgi:hypothetical protein
MKMPGNWPSALKLKKLSKADNFGSGAEWGVFEGNAEVAAVYRSSRGWAFSGSLGQRGSGYSGYDTMLDALWDLASRYRGARE